MSTYTPDGWIILKIGGPEPFYKVFGSWRGGFTSGDSWRMNSGIVSVEETGENYIFRGHSGSEYHCGKKGYGRLGLHNSAIIMSYAKRSSGMLEVIQEMPDIMSMNWSIND
tara:strand:+ start:85 stop:417 length:333 start_codon:yes stop_codon:yes gene_type:complete